MRIGFIGGDRRITACANAARRDGHEVLTACLSGDLPSLSPALLSHSVDVLVLPIPAARDGVHITGTDVAFSSLPLKDGLWVVGGQIPEDFHREDVLFYDILKDEALQWKNAYLTALGAVNAAASATERGLYRVSAAVLGYGRIGKQLSRMLFALGAKVTVYARRTAVLAEAAAQGYEALPLEKGISLDQMLVFNTIPKGASLHISLGERTLSYDLGGGLSAYGETVSMRGVPGVFAPVAAGEVMYEALCSFLFQHFGKDLTR